MKGGSSETNFLQDLILYTASAALSSLVLFVGLRSLDPNREASKKALDHKKEIARRLGRPLIQTNSYEVMLSVCLFVCVAVCSCRLDYLLHPSLHVLRLIDILQFRLVLFDERGI